MKNRVAAAFAALCLAALSCGTGVAQVAATSPGDEAFAAGNFDEAATQYEAALRRNANDARAVLGLGTVELYRNDLAAATKDLQRAVTLAPDPVQAQARLAVVRQRIGIPGDYRISFAAREARVPLVSIDPLPTLKATIDGVPVTLAIDTGGPNLDLSQALVNRLHLAAKPAGQGVFAGGLKAPIQTVRIDRLALPGVTVRGIPGGVIPGEFGIADGIIGTAFLYHFLSTIDYTHRALVLRPVQQSAAFLAGAKASGATAIPMWLVSDHLVFARARINDAPEGLFSIDTGGPGVGVDLSKSELAAAGITPDASRPQTMMGAGGPTPALPFSAASVSMGGVTLHDLPGLYLPDAPTDMFPFAVAGRISHEFFRHTAATFDFTAMKLVLSRS